jgi:uncharacterized delta-60 repeat protein
MKPLFRNVVWVLLLLPTVWSPRAVADQTNLPFALDQPVRSMSLQADGKVVIGGDFTVAAGAVRGHVARLNADGTTDAGFMSNLAGADRAVYSTVIQPDGQIFIGGIFGSVDGIARTGLARLTTNGGLDMTFNAVTGSAPVAVQSDGKVLTGTALLSNDGTRDALFRLRPDGTRDTNWAVALSGGTVNAVAQQSDGKVVIVGTFAAVNGTNRAGIARLTTNGLVDTTFQNGMSGAPGEVKCLALQPDGKVLIGGYFFFVDGTARTRLARLNPDGSLDTTFQNGMAGADNDPQAIALQPDGKVLIGGYFTSVNNTPRSGIARLNTDGSLDATFQNGMAGTDVPVVLALAFQPDGKVIIGGGFTAVNGVVRYRIARLNPDGSVDPFFHNGGLPPPVLANAGIHSNHFMFQLSGQSNEVIVVEASTNLLNWVTLATKTLTGSPLQFTDPSPATLRTRFYRARVH